ncbi:MAG: hypothetical protein O2804_02340 [Verrucomicrobia bacterium]|nr:hypothetical protein [Verrucomicrobiota bacterium]
MRHRHATGRALTGKTYDMFRANIRCQEGSPDGKKTHMSTR